MGLGKAGVICSFMIPACAKPGRYGNPISAMQPQTEEFLTLILTTTQDNHRYRF